MLVKDYMMKHPPMVGPDASMVEAQHLMTENAVQYLPVVKDGKRLVGLLTRESMLINPGRLSSLDVWDIARYLSNLKVKNVMIKKRDVVTIDAEATIEQAARIMVDNQVPCLPVIRDDVVAGLITENHLLVQLTELMAGYMPGIRVTVRMPMIKGELAKLVSALAEHNLGIIAMGGVTAPKDPTQWDAVVKVRGSKEEVVEALSKVEDHEIIDVREF